MDFPSLLEAADRAALHHLGGALVYEPEAGDPVEVRGIFENTDVNVVVQGQEIMSSGPRVFLRLSDLPSDPSGEGKGWPRIVRGGVTYATQDVHRDGHGGVLLTLSEVA